MYGRFLGGCEVKDGYLVDRLIPSDAFLGHSSEVLSVNAVETANNEYTVASGDARGFFCLHKIRKGFPLQIGVHFAKSLSFKLPINVIEKGKGKKTFFVGAGHQACYIDLDTFSFSQELNDSLNKSTVVDYYCHEGENMVLDTKGFRSTHKDFISDLKPEDKEQCLKLIGYSVVTSQGRLVNYRTGSVFLDGIPCNVQSSAYTKGLLYLLGIDGTLYKRDLGNLTAQFVASQVQSLHERSYIDSYGQSINLVAQETIPTVNVAEISVMPGNQLMAYGVKWTHKPGKPTCFTMRIIDSINRLVAVGDDQRRVKIYKINAEKAEEIQCWTHHASRITHLAFFAASNTNQYVDGLRLASAALDDCVMIYEPLIKNIIADDPFTEWRECPIIIKLPETIVGLHVATIEHELLVVTGDGCIRSLTK